MSEKILILDFGSQYTQLIARRVREINVYCEIVPYNKIPDFGDEIKGIILSGSPFSVNSKDALEFDLKGLLEKKPILGVCYGAQYICKALGGLVAKSDKREYGKAELDLVGQDENFFAGLSATSQVWMSHADTIVNLPSGFEILATTENIPVAAFKAADKKFANPLYGIQFHPEVYHSVEGTQLIKNFVHGICGCSGNWTAESFIENSITELKTKIGSERVLMALSGGVDSTVGAMLLHRAIGKNLHCFFIDNGLLRKGEFEQVLASYQGMGLNIKGIDSKDKFLGRLNGVKDPEEKRKIIGNTFIEVFDEAAETFDNCEWLGQGTIYPDVIESISVHGPSVTIKSHHNVGGLPEDMKFKIVEPLRMLFKDEVRRVGTALGIKKSIIGRHPFPGPGLAIRILGEITPERVALLQEADAVYIDNLKKSGWYDKVWQAGAILLPIQSVGVMGDERTYEQVVALRCVNSVDGMTADWSHLPFEVLGKISTEIINNVKGINRVVYDISTKPPATIEWE